MNAGSLCAGDNGSRNPQGYRDGISTFFSLPLNDGQESADWPPSGFVLPGVRMRLDCRPSYEIASLAAVPQFLHLTHADESFSATGGRPKSRTPLRALRGASRGQIAERVRVRRPLSAVASVRSELPCRSGPPHRVAGVAGAAGGDHDAGGGGEPLIFPGRDAGGHGDRHPVGGCAGGRVTMHLGPLRPGDLHCQVDDAGESACGPQLGAARRGDQPSGTDRQARRASTRRSRSRPAVRAAGTARSATGGLARPCWLATAEPWAWATSIPCDCGDNHEL